MGAAVGKKGEVQSEINVTPMIDVCLVLLIIFMVITPMLQKGTAVQLPVTDGPQKKPDHEGQVLISVDFEGKLFVEQDWLPESEFLSRLKSVYDRDAMSELAVKGDQRLEYGKVLEVMRMCHEVGFTKVALITKKKEDEEGG